MRVKTIKNRSNEDVQLDVGNGSMLTLSPGDSFKNIQVENLDQIKSRVDVTSDLGEIGESIKHTTKLFD